MADDKRFAVLIDADNVSAKYIKYIMDEVTNFGIATYKRIYGDWTRPNVSAWKEILLENSVTPIQQYGYTVGKNATDSAMIIDAMDILYSGHVDGYCIVSSDSDFTKLASRLRESGMIVVGMGERKTPKPFIAACNQFKYLDILAETEKKSMEIEDEETIKSDGGKKKEASNKDLNQLASTTGTVKKAPTQENNEIAKTMTDINIIKMTIKKMMDESDAGNQSINIAEIGNRLAKRYPDFDVRNYGDTKLSKFLRRFDFIEIETKGNLIWASLKSEDGKEQSKISKATDKKVKRTYKKVKDK